MPEQSTVRDPRSLFDIDERLVELMDQVADAAADGQEPPSELIEEINEYIEAFHSKVDRIAGYLRWQESIASICGAEAERLSARKKSAEGRVSRLKNMLLHFMLSRGLKRLEGERAAIGLQPADHPPRGPALPSRAKRRQRPLARSARQKTTTGGRLD